MDINEFTTATKALSDPQRLRALLALRGGELCVCQIIEMLGLAPSTVSKHMSVLKQAGLVKYRKDSRWVYYRLPDCWENHWILNTVVQNLQTDNQVFDDEKSLKKIAANGLEIICHKQRKQ